MSFSSNSGGFSAPGSGIARSTAAGAVAAVVGAILWMVFVQVTGYEVGIVAVGIGFLVGQTMAVTAGTSTRLPPVGAVLSLLGCLLGQLLTDAHFFGEAVGIGTGQALQEMLSDPSLGWDVFTAGLSPIDLLFWLIAGYEGYKLTARAVEQHRAGPSQPAEPPVADYFPPAGTASGPTPSV